MMGQNARRPRLLDVVRSGEIRTTRPSAFDFRRRSLIGTPFVLMPEVIEKREKNAELADCVLKSISSLDVVNTADGYR